MRLGRVIGSVVATRKDPSLEGVKLLVVENLTLDLEPEGGYVVAVDAVGAGANEVILYASGSLPGKRILRETDRWTRSSWQ